jgi:hypothetical protein
MLTKHSLTSNSAIDIVETQIGELVTNFDNQGIYTKSASSKLIRAGKSKRKLTDFSIYESGIVTGNYTFSLVQFANIGNALKLTTAFPFIPINNLGNTILDPNNYNVKSYLGIGVTNKVENISTPSFSIIDLGDVALSSSDLNANTHNYVLTARRLGVAVTNKDPFIPRYEYIWTLLPESTKLLEFADTTKNPLVPYQVIRSFLPSEKRGERVENKKLTISYDVSPKLGGNLDSNRYSIYNLKYRTNQIDVTSELGTIICDCEEFSIFVINCVDTTNGLFIDFSYNGSNLASISVIINNFNGFINFRDTIQFENGVGVVLSGNNHIFNVLIYNDTNGKVVRLMQKATNIN